MFPKLANHSHGTNNCHPERKHCRFLCVRNEKHSFLQYVEISDFCHPDSEDIFSESTLSVIDEQREQTTDFPREGSRDCSGDIGDEKEQR